MFLLSVFKVIPDDIIKVIKTLLSRCLCFNYRNDNYEDHFSYSEYKLGSLKKYIFVVYTRTSVISIILKFYSFIN